MTIKEVLNTFADAEVAFRRHGTVVGKGCPSGGRWRTVVGVRCPLQVATGQDLHAQVLALDAGLLADEVGAIMEWADTGRWRV